MQPVGIPALVTGAVNLAGSRGTRWRHCLNASGLSLHRVAFEMDVLEGAVCHGGDSKHEVPQLVSRRAKTTNVKSS